MLTILTNIIFNTGAWVMLLFGAAAYVAVKGETESEEQ